MVATSLPETMALVKRAGVYLHLARALVYPTEALLAELGSGAWGQDLGRAVEGLDSNGRLMPVAEQVERAAREVGGGPIGLAEEYTYLFLRQTPAPPYGTSYGRGLSRAYELQEVGGFYAAFGLRVAEDRHDLPDHIGAELEFVGLLLAKEAYALATGLAEPAAVCREARAGFVGRHLANWLPEFQARLAANARLAFYPALAALAWALLALEPVEAPAEVAAAGAPSEEEEDAFVCSLVDSWPAEPPDLVE